MHVRRRRRRRTTLITVAWCGDSRAYWLGRRRRGAQLTVDHSLGTEMIAAGRTRAEAEADPTCHTITRWLGADSVDPTPEFAVASSDRARAGCSSAATGCGTTLSDAAELATLSCGPPASADPLAVADAPRRSANAGGGHDNITAALARCDPIATACRPERTQWPSSPPSVFQNEYLADGRHRRARRRVGHVHRRRHRRQPGTARPPRSSSSTRRARWTCRRPRSSRPGRRPRSPSTRSSTARGSPSSSANTSARWCYPPHPGMARMDADATRRAATAAIDELRPAGRPRSARGC